MSNFDRFCILSLYVSGKKCLSLYCVASMFTVSWRAVFSAWLIVYPTLVSSAFSLPLRRLCTRCPLRSCAWRFGSGCRRFFRVRRCNPANRNSQCLFHTLKDTVNKKLDASLDFADKAVVYLNFLFLCSIFHFDRIMDYYLFNQRV